GGRRGGPAPLKGGGVGEWVFGAIARGVDDSPRPASPVTLNRRAGALYRGSSSDGMTGALGSLISPEQRVVPKAPARCAQRRVGALFSRSRGKLHCLAAALWLRRQDCAGALGRLAQRIVKQVRITSAAGYAQAALRSSATKRQRLHRASTSV